jgi:hypothetical protein
MDEDLPQRDSAKVEALANAIRELATGMRAADVVKALASVSAYIAATTDAADSAQALLAYPRPGSRRRPFYRLRRIIFCAGMDRSLPARNLRAASHPAFRLRHIGVRILRRGADGRHENE